MTVLNFEQMHPSFHFGLTRSWDAFPNLDWAEIRPTADVYQFRWFDRFILMNQSRGTEMIYTFGRTPQSISSLPNARSPYGLGQCAPPADLTEWDRYVRTLVTHAAGRIRYWEIWNEADDPRFYCGDIPTLVEMTRRARQIIKSVDPAAVILSPSVTGEPGPDWLSRYLKAGGKSYVDAIAFHGYWSASAEDMLDVVARYQAVMRANNVERLQLWDTEASWSAFGNSGTPSTAQQVSFIAESYLLQWSSGVARFVWFAYDGGPIWGGLQSSVSGESAAAVAYRQTYRWMVGATLIQPCERDHRGIWRCFLSRPGGYMGEVVWRTGQSTNLNVSPMFRMYSDLNGETHTIAGQAVVVGEKPVLIENKALNGDDHRKDLEAGQ